MDIHGGGGLGGGAIRWITTTYPTLDVSRGGITTDRGILSLSILQLYRINAMRPAGYGPVLSLAPDTDEEYSSGRVPTAEFDESPMN